MSTTPNTAPDNKPDPHARLKAYAAAGARIRCGGGDWFRIGCWGWINDVQKYEVHPDDLHLAPEYAPAASPAQPPAEANTELDQFKSFFGKASILLHQIDGGGDNGDTENFLKRLAQIPQFKLTDEEAEVVSSLMRSQDLTAAQVIRQALRHYQMFVHQQAMPAEAKTPGQVLWEAINSGTEKVSWSWIGDQPSAQKKYEDAAQAVLATFGGQACLEAAIARMEAVPLGELRRIWRKKVSSNNQDLEAVRARLIAAAREGQGEKLWCAYCGKWGDHQSGWCRAISREVSAPTLAVQPNAAEEWKTRAEKAEIEITEAKSILQQVDLPDEPLAIQAQRMKDQYEWQLGIARGYEKQIQQANERLASITTAAHEAGWNGVENPKDLAEFIKEQGRTLEEWKAKAEKWEEEARRYCQNADYWRAEAQKANLSHLRPLAEAGPVPEGAVRVYHDCKWLNWTQYKDKHYTHFADILLPEAQSAVEAKSDPYAELKAAHAAGKVIQHFDGIKWHDVDKPRWNPLPHQYRIKPEPETFEAHGKTWTRHMPGDPMPCDGEAKVDCLLPHGIPLGVARASARKWHEHIIGWRYADSPTPEPAQPWQPAVGNVVRLKSGGPEMTLHRVDVGGVADCFYFTNGHDFHQVHLPIACLEPALAKPASQG